MNGLTIVEAVNMKVTAVECLNGAFLSTDETRRKGRNFCSKAFVVSRAFQLTCSEQVYCESKLKNLK